MATSRGLPYSGYNRVASENGQNECIAINSVQFQNRIRNLEHDRSIIAQFVSCFNITQENLGTCILLMDFDRKCCACRQKSA